MHGLVDDLGRDWSPIAIWFVTSAVPCGKAVPDLERVNDCFLPLNLPFGSDVSASQRTERGRVALTIDATPCLIVAVFAAAVFLRRAKSLACLVGVVFGSLLS